MPAWLPELGEAIARLRFTHEGLSEPMSEGAFRDLEAKLVGSTDTSELAIWARSFLNFDGSNPK
jgi:hypothetical protein